MHVLDRLQNMADPSSKSVALYLDGRTIETCHGKSFCGETQAVLLLSQYCEKVFASLVLVSNDQTDNAPQIGVKLPEDCYLSTSYSTWENVPSKVRCCKFPAVFSQDEVDIYSGLCTVLRYLVKRSANLSSSPDSRQRILSLLGHRLYCLKACSEVSPRTKLCEFYMPDVFKRQADVPPALSLFEQLMNEPVVIHNMDKRQRVLLQNIGDETKGKLPNKRKRKEVVWTKNLPQLEHVFAEGVDFSLTDISIFPAVHHFIKRNPSISRDFPMTLKWYQRLKMIGPFLKAAQKCHLTLVSDQRSSDAKINSNKDGVTQMLELATSATEQTSPKKDESLTIRRDLPGLLRKLDTDGVTISYKEYDMKRIILPWSEMPHPLHPVEGELGTLRASRKCSQIENLAFAVKSVAEDGDTVVDFCSGGCKICLVENKEESLERARSRIKALGMKNVTIYQCNLEYFCGDFQVGVALHACGVATDMVVQSCIAKNASFVISPCCYGKVRNCHWISYPQSKLFKEIPLSFDESLLLGHAADKTSWDFKGKHALEGKLCMGFMDTDRVNAARESGYTAALYTMQPPSCTPKNNLLVGKSPRTDIGNSTLKE